MPLDNALLYNFVKDSISPYSENFRFENRTNPTEFFLNGHSYSTHVSYVHDSGNSRDNDDEVRIQIGRALIEEQRSRANAGKRVAFLGFFEGGEAFVAWDPRHVFSLQARTVVSVYARQSQLAAVRLNQAAVHQFRARFLEAQSFAIALPAEALGFYLENVEHFHRLPSEDSIVGLMQDHSSTFTENGLGSSGDFDVEDGELREKFTYERTSYPRDPRFKKRVLDAYERTCCVCDRQLGLIEAAHIIPHSVDGSPNEVSNGLALCIEHHRLYDRALLLPGPGQRLVFNDERADYLTQTNQKKGLEEIEALNGREYKVPEDPANKPKDEYLERGLEIRMAG